MKKEKTKGISISGKIAIRQTSVPYSWFGAHSRPCYWSANVTVQAATRVA